MRWVDLIPDYIRKGAVKGNISMSRTRSRAFPSVSWSLLSVCDAGECMDLASQGEFGLKSNATIFTGYGYVVRGVSSWCAF